MNFFIGIDQTGAVLVENAVDNAHEAVRSNHTGLFVDCVFGISKDLIVQT